MKSLNRPNKLKVISFLSAGLMFFALLPGSFSQESNGNKHKANNGSTRLEYPGGEYIPSPRSTHPRSPAYRYFSAGISTVQVNVDENGDNIVNDAANEPSISYNAGNPDEIVIGWRQFDNINNSFRQGGYGFSKDGGQTWTFPGVINPGVFRSDPVLRNDGQGNIFYNTLTSQNDSYWTNTYKSTDGGETWEMGTFSQGGDKQWIAIDRSEGIGEGNIYEFWNGAYSVCSPDDFTRSTDGNESYESCSSIPAGPYWGTAMVSPDGELFVCGAEWGGFMLAKSSTAQDPGDNVSWDWTVSVNLGGEIIGFGGEDCPNPDGLLGQTIIAMDSSGGPGDGNIYLLCSVDKFTNSDPCDVMFVRSTDGGLNWSTPVRVNDDIGNNAYQWFGTMSVAPDGRIDVIWLDTRGNLGTVNSALYYSYSLDEGVTWTPNVRLSETFNPHVGWPQQNKMGDYFDMYSDEDGAHLAWAATFNGEQDVYYSLIVPSYVDISENEADGSITGMRIFPNPFKGQATISYNLRDAGFTTLKVFTATGMEIKSLVNETQIAGYHQLIFDASELEAGVYYCKLNRCGPSSVERFIILK
jgi:hypothetical protein